MDIFPWLDDVLHLLSINVSAFEESLVEFQKYNLSWDPELFRLDRRTFLRVTEGIGDLQWRESVFEFLQGSDGRLDFTEVSFEQLLPFIFILFSC